jgi:DNA-binding transcriptional ArsR family regulator
VKSLAHELRAEILAILNERMASPNELAKELDEGLSQVSYHVKVLKDYGVIRLVKTEPRRGAVEHYYRATSRAYLTDRDWHELPRSVRDAMSADLFQMILDDVIASLEGEVFDERSDRHMSWTPMMVDDQGWKQVNGIIDGALKQILKVQAESVKRLSKSGEDGINMSVAMLGYQVPEKAAKKLPKRKSKSRAKGKAKAKSKAKAKAKRK